MKIFSVRINYSLFISLVFFTANSALARDKFKVCADPLNPPYSEQDQSGYENKIAALFARESGQELEYAWFPDRMGFIRNTLKAENADGKGYKCDVVMGLPTGSDIAETTRPYLRSTYVLLVRKGRGWDDITDPAQLSALPEQKQRQLKIAMFDRGPGTAWLQKQGLLEQGVPYQSMTGDKEHNIALQIEKDLHDGAIDMVILWGPMAGFVQMRHPGEYFSIPMQSTPDIRFDFSIAMAVRQGDDKRKQLLNELIEKNRDKIHDIIAGYGIIMLPLTEESTPKSD
ncbi:MAG: quinoprotein dehydrogenase-associated putative ABC transporter substrate-binding protein [Methylomonas sp.]